MAILINKDTKVIVQGITGKAARFHTEQMRKFGTNIVAGVSPGKAGPCLVQGHSCNSIRSAMLSLQPGPMLPSIFSTGSVGC